MLLEVEDAVEDEVEDEDEVEVLLLHGQNCIVTEICPSRQIVKIKKIFDRLGYSQTSISDFRSDIGDSEYFLSFIILRDVC